MTSQEELHPLPSLGRGAGLGKQSKTTALFPPLFPHPLLAHPLTPAHPAHSLLKWETEQEGICPRRPWSLTQPGAGRPEHWWL